MKLKKLRLENFRSYRELNINFDDNMNVIIGKNDVGKSTIMEALEIFFNNELVKLQQEDLNIYAKEDGMATLRIILSFKLEDSDTIVIDSSNPTNLEDEFLLDKDGLLTLIQEWDCSKNITTKSKKYFLECEYPKVWKENPKINVTNANLKKELKSLFDDEIISEEVYESITKSANAPMRQALYKYSLEEEDKKDRTTIQIDLAKSDESKGLKESIDKNLPLYFLFQSDRANKDSDDDVQNPLKIAIQKALQNENIKNMLDEVERLMKEQIKQVGDDTLAKLREMDANIASTLNPNYTKEPDWRSVFKFNFTGDGVPLNKRGSGVRRLVLLNYFRAEADRKVNDRYNKSVIYAIEEPETSQHPDYQQMLIESLLELANHKDHQVIITTHTPNIAKMVEFDNVIALIKDTNGKIIEYNDEDEKIQTIIDTLGILPSINLENIQKVKVVVCFEGYTDIEFIKNINQNIDEYKNIIDINDESVFMIFLGGSTLEHWVNNRYLEKLNIPEIHIYDSDTNQIDERNRHKYKKIIDRINRRNNNDIAFETKKAELENYIHPDIIKAKYGFDTIYHTQSENWIETWSNLINMEKYVKENKTNQEHTKKGNFSELSKQITKQHLAELEAFDEIKEWFEKIKEATRG